VDEARQPGEDRRSDALSRRGACPAAGADPAFEPLPQSLRLRLDRCANDWLQERAAQCDVEPTTRQSRKTLRWLVALAGVALVIVGSWSPLAEFEASVAAAGGFTQWRAHRQRERMLAEGGVQHWAWGGASETGAGDVVWHSQRQRGYLRLRGFVPNDPSRAQYQLWIFDADRIDDRPVTGGVFDVPAGRHDVVVPLHPTLPVSRAVAFAVTVERPGGVAIPNRDKVVAFAHAGA
jgi:Anti-sigma-K factor rskA